MFMCKKARRIPRRIMARLEHALRTTLGEFKSQRSQCRDTEFRAMSRILGCDEPALYKGLSGRKLSIARAIVLLSCSVGSSWGCRVRSGYSTVVYGSGWCACRVYGSQCAVCSAAKTNSQTQEITGVREDGRTNHQHYFLTSCCRFPNRHQWQ